LTEENAKQKLERLFDGEKMQAETGGTVCSPFPDSTIIKTIMQNYLVQVLTIDWNVNQTSWYFNKKLQGNFRKD
jgi:hypothetical protein